MRDVLRAVSRREPVAVRQVSRATELPVPLVSAICNELRKRGVVDRRRPVRLTPYGRRLLEAAGGGATLDRLARPAPDARLWFRRRSK